MTQLSFPILPDGLVADVLVNLPLTSLLPLWAAGQPPTAQPGRGLVDTGSNVSGVAQSILAQLGLSLELQGSTTGITGPMAVDFYRVCFHVCDQRNLLIPWLSKLSLLVMELPSGFPLDALIGLDVLLTCKLIVDGPAGIFTLEF
jgi:hypothetical protein